MYHLYYTNSKNVTVDLTDMTDCQLISIDGLGMPQASFAEVSTPLKDGVRIASMKREKRNILVQVEMRGLSNNQQIRKRMYSIFGEKGQGTIRYEDDTLNVFTEAYCESIDTNIWTLKPTVQISFLCPDPLFKSSQKAGQRVFQITPMLEFPLDLPVQGKEFGLVSELSNLNLTNSGQIDAPCEIDITISGAVTNPTIYNYSTGKYISLEASFSEGEKIKINTALGNKYVKKINVNNTETDLYYAMTAGSEWIDIAVGSNTMYVNADSGSANLVATFMYYEYYWGLD